VDRGGLIHINEMFYLCLISIEKVYKSCVCSQDASELGDIKSKITEKVLGNVDIKFYWDLAVGLITMEVLLQMVIDLFLTVCRHAFTKGFVEKYKQERNRKSLEKIILILLVFFVTFINFSSLL